MSNYKEIAKHSGNYFFAMVATKALDFIAIPVYTYLLTVEEYGVFNMFLSTVGIATILLTLNTEVAISRYYFDTDDVIDFKKFVGTNMRLTLAVFFIISLCMVIGVIPLSSYLNFEYLLTLAIIPVSLYRIVNSIFQQIYQPLLESRKIAVVSSVQSYMAFFLSILCIYLLPEKKYYGQVLGTILAMLVVGVYSLRQIKEYYISGWNLKYVKYILNYSLPYLPYSLSGIIIAQLGRLILGRINGFEAAGVYSFASNISMVMLVLISVVHSAWNPYYFRYMNDKDYTSIDRDYDLIWRVTLFVGVAVSLFCYEIGNLVGPSEYNTDLHIIPILVLGYIFYQWAYVYMRNVGYAKKTIWNAIVVVFSGVVNILLNAILIAPLGTLGIAVSFSVAYLFMLVLGAILNKYVLKCYAPKLLSFIKPLVYSTILIICTIITPFKDCNLGLVLLKSIVLIVFAVILFWKYKNYILRRS